MLSRSDFLIGRYMLSLCFLSLPYPQANQDLLLTFVEAPSTDDQQDSEMTLGGGGGGGGSGGVSPGDWLGDNSQANQLEDSYGEEQGEEAGPPKPGFKGHKFVLMGMEKLADKHRWAKSQR